MEKFYLVIFDEETKEPVVIEEVTAENENYAYYEFFKRGHNVPLIMDQERWDFIKRYNTSHPLTKA
jgi:hypothetical protein